MTYYRRIFHNQEENTECNECKSSITKHLRHSIFKTFTKAILEEMCKNYTDSPKTITFPRKYVHYRRNLHLQTNSVRC